MLLFIIFIIFLFLLLSSFIVFLFFFIKYFFIQNYNVENYNGNDIVDVVINKKFKYKFSILKYQTPRFFNYNVFTKKYYISRKKSKNLSIWNIHSCLIDIIVFKWSQEKKVIRQIPKVLFKIAPFIFLFFLIFYAFIFNIEIDQKKLVFFKIDIFSWKIYSYNEFYSWILISFLSYSILISLFNIVYISGIKKEIKSFIGQYLSYKESKIVIGILNLKFFMMILLSLFLLLNFFVEILFYIKLKWKNTI